MIKRLVDSDKYRAAFSILATPVFIWNTGSLAALGRSQVLVLAGGHLSFCAMLYGLSQNFPASYLSTGLLFWVWHEVSIRAYARSALPSVLALPIVVFGSCSVLSIVVMLLGAGFTYGRIPSLAALAGVGVLHYLYVGLKLWRLAKPS